MPEANSLSENDGQPQHPRRHPASQDASPLQCYMDACQNHGPLLGPLNSRCRSMLRTPKRDPNVDNHPYGTSLLEGATFVIQGSCSYSSRAIGWVDSNFLASTPRGTSSRLRWPASMLLIRILPVTYPERPMQRKYRGIRNMIFKVSLMKPFWALWVG